MAKWTIGLVSLTRPCSRQLIPLFLHHSFLVEKSLQPLSQLLGIDQDTLAGELPIAAQLCRNKLQQDSTLEEATLTMRQYQEAFPSVYQLYAGALTIGVSTATCENSLSANACAATLPSFHGP